MTALTVLATWIQAGMQMAAGRLGREEGQGAIEYAIVVAIVVTVVALAFGTDATGTFGSAVKAAVGDITTAVAGA